MKKLYLFILLSLMAAMVIIGCSGSASSTDVSNDIENASSMLERHGEAIDVYGPILKTEPNTPTAWYMRGFAFYGLGEYDKAIEAYDQALNMSPDDNYFWASKGLALFKLGRYDEALEAYNQALQIDPNYTYGLNGKGLVLAKLGKYEEAIEAYDQALQIVEANGVKENDPFLIKLKENKEAVLNLLKK